MSQTPFFGQSVPKGGAIAINNFLTEECLNFTKMYDSNVYLTAFMKILALF